jgi:hypothetical protein
MSARRAIVRRTRREVNSGDVNASRIDRVGGQTLPAPFRLRDNCGRALWLDGPAGETLTSEAWRRN